MFLDDFCWRIVLGREGLLLIRNCCVLLIFCRLASLIKGLPFMECGLLIEEINLVSDLIIIIVMTEIADYFNRFFHIVLKPLISDPLVHSEWTYFLSMFKNSPIDSGRIELYLDIINKDHKKNVGTKTSDKDTSSINSVHSA